MDYSEAIAILEEQYRTVSMCISSSHCLKHNKAIKMAVEAMKKQIPMKAVGTHYAHMRCPSCDHRIPSGGGSSSRRRDNWCNYCGQKIDWSEL